MEHSNISNNAWPLADGQCCDDCNSKVILARLKVYLDEMMGEEN